MSNPSPEEFIPKFRRKRLDEPGFLRKIARFAGRLGAPAVRQLYALYFLFKDPATPRRAKMIILARWFISSARLTAFPICSARWALPMTSQ